MTDRELLELAAKAAALDLEWCEPWACMARNLGVIDGFDRHTCWDPLKDDGDALRLAVKLGITAIQDKVHRVCAAYWTDCMCCNESYLDDEFAATRRAITRAAAQIQLDKENQ